MKTRKLVPAASAALLLGMLAFLTGCDLSGGGDGGGGGGAETPLARVDPRTYTPQYQDSYIKGVIDGAKPATDSSSVCGGRELFDGAKCKPQDDTAVKAGDGSGQTNPDSQLKKPDGQADKKPDDVPPPTAEAAACQQVLKNHGQMGESTCLKHATTALVFAGARSVFTTRPDWKQMLSMGLATAAGYALGALTGVGTLAILAKVGYALLLAGGIVGFLSVMRDAWQADKDRRSHPADSEEHADAVWRESRLVATLVLMLLSAVGPKAMEMLKTKMPAAPAVAASEAEPAAAAVKTQLLLPASKIPITDPRRLLPAPSGS